MPDLLSAMSACHMLTCRLGGSMLTQRAFRLDNLTSALRCTLPMHFESLGRSHQRHEGAGGLLAEQEGSVAGECAASPGTVLACHTSQGKQPLYLYSGIHARVSLLVWSVLVRDVCGRSSTSYMASGETVRTLNYWCRAGWATQVFSRGWVLLSDC